MRHHGLNDQGKFTLHGCTLEHTPQEYPSFGLGEMREGAVTVRRHDGTRSCDLRFVSAEEISGKPALNGLPATFGKKGKTLLMHLEDALLGMKVTLSYSLFDDCGAVMRSAKFENASEKELHLERAYSLCLDLPDGCYDVMTLSGAWGRERESNPTKILAYQYFFAFVAVFVAELILKF